jgi:hypothetical protein
MVIGNPQTSVSDLVEQLGGPKAVGKALQLPLGVVANWSYRNQVPTRHHLALWAFAQRKNVDWRPPGAEGLALPPFIRATSSDHTTVMPGSDQVDSAA